MNKYLEADWNEQRCRLGQKSWARVLVRLLINHMMQESNLSKLDP